MPTASVRPATSAESSSSSLDPADDSPTTPAERRHATLLERRTAWWHERARRQKQLGWRRPGDQGNLDAPGRPAESRRARASCPSCRNARWVAGSLLGWARLVAGSARCSCGSTTVRLDFDGARLAGAGVAACLNWDGGVRAEYAEN